MTCTSSISVNHLHLHVQIFLTYTYPVAVYIYEGNVNICQIRLHMACVNVFGSVSVTVNTIIICKVTLSLCLLSFQTLLSRVSIK
jgi:hypothetical protein